MRVFEYMERSVPGNGAGPGLLEWLSEVGRQGWELKDVERYDEGGWWAVVQRESHAPQGDGDAG